MKKSNIPSIHLLSNPLGSLPKLLLTQESFVNPSTLHVPGLKKELLEEILAKSFKRAENDRLQQTIEKYKLYMNSLSDHLSSFQNKHIIFLDFLAPTLVSRETTFSRNGICDFNGLNRFPDYLIEKIYMQASKRVKEALHNEILFWRLSPYDFPFQFIIKNNTPAIKNLFAQQANEINDYLLAKGKSGFGNQTRLYKEHMAIGNYKFSPIIYSLTTFRNHLHLDGTFELLYQSYQKVYGAISPEKLLALMEGATKINFALLKQKYKFISQKLTPIRKTAYMTKNTRSYQLLSSITDLELPGNGLARQGKIISFLGELDSLALRKLHGYLRALYDPTGPIPRLDKEKIFPQLAEDRSKVYPYSINLGKADVDKSFSTFDEGKRFFLEQDVRNFQFGVQSIESIIYDFNTHDYPVILEDGRTGRLRELVGDSKIQPLVIKQLAQQRRGLSRPSNSSAKCELLFTFAIQKQSFWPKEITQNSFADSGHALHHLGNEVKSKQHQFLSDIGITPTARSNYCEVPLSYTVELTPKQWNELEDLIEARFETTKNPFYAELYNYYTKARARETMFIDGGSPDGVLLVEDERAPIVVDFKRRMKSYYPIESFFTQTARYALAIKESISTIGDHFYLAIIQRPFSPNQFLGREATIDSGKYRKPVKVVRRVAYESDFVDSVCERVAFEQLCVQLTQDNPLLAQQLRAVYNTEKQKQHSAHCNSCFSNRKEDFKCHYYFTGEKTPWSSDF